MAQIELTESQLENMIELFEIAFIPFIRNDVEIDNMEYLVDMSAVYTKLKVAKSECEKNKE